MGNITLTGIDLSKEVFEVRSENKEGRLVKRQTVRRGSLSTIISKLPAGSTIAMEACGTSHYWGREFVSKGYRVLLIAPQHVTPYRQSQKNDCNDAQAICEAARRPNMKFVSIKSEEQLDLQMVHRVREQMVAQRTALTNQVRGLLLEHGFAIPKGIAQFRKKFQLLVSTAGEGNVYGFILLNLWQQFSALEEQINKFTLLIQKKAKEMPDCQKIMELDGIGPITATAVVASVGSPTAFKNGRAFAASLGLVPRQFSTGGKTILGRITKQGDGYLRKLLVHGARAAVRQALLRKKHSSKDLWIIALHQRKGTNVTSVALANKTARNLWAILAGKSPQILPLPQAA